MTSVVTRPGLWGSHYLACDFQHERVVSGDNYSVAVGSVCCLQEPNMHKGCLRNGQCIFTVKVLLSRWQGGSSVSALLPCCYRLHLKFQACIKLTALNNYDLRTSFSSTLPLCSTCLCSPCSLFKCIKPLHMSLQVFRYADFMVNIRCNQVLSPKLGTF